MLAGNESKAMSGKKESGWEKERRRGFSISLMSHPLF